MSRRVRPVRLVSDAPRLEVGQLVVEPRLVGVPGELEQLDSVEQGAHALPERGAGDSLSASTRLDATRAVLREQALDGVALTDRAGRAGAGPWRVVRRRRGQLGRSARPPRVIAARGCGLLRARRRGGGSRRLRGPALRRSRPNRRATTSEQDCRRESGLELGRALEPDRGQAGTEECEQRRDVLEGIHDRSPTPARRRSLRPPRAVRDRVPPGPWTVATARRRPRRR